MVDRLFERLSFDPSERTSVDAVDSFVALTHSIFSKRKAVDRHCEYIVEKFGQNSKDTEYYVAPKHVESLLGDLLEQSKGDLLVSKAKGINEKTEALLTKMDDDMKHREDTAQTYTESLKNLKEKLSNDIETKTKQFEQENGASLDQIKKKFQKMNECISQMTIEQLKSEDSFNVPMTQDDPQMENESKSDAKQ